MKKTIKLCNRIEYPVNDFLTEDWTDIVLCKGFVRTFFEKVDTNKDAMLILSTSRIVGGKKVFLVSNMPEIRYALKKVSFECSQYIYFSLQKELKPLMGKSKSKWIWVKVENV